MRIVYVVMLLLLNSAEVAAQVDAVWLGAGAAVPTGGAGDRYSPGPAAALSLEAGLNSHFAIRLDADWSRLGGGEIASYPADLRTYGGSLNALLGPSEGRVRPYALVGLGGYRLQRIGDNPSVYGTTAAVQAGLGIEASAWHAVEPFIEARSVVHITDYASDEFTASILWPVIVGLRLPVGR